MVNITKFAVRRPITIVLCLITIAYFGVQSLLGTKLELCLLYTSDAADEL